MFFLLLKLHRLPAVAKMDCLENGYFHTFLSSSCPSGAPGIFFAMLMPPLPVFLFVPIEAYSLMAPILSRPFLPPPLCTFSCVQGVAFPFPFSADAFSFEVDAVAHSSLLFQFPFSWTAPRRRKKCFFFPLRADFLSSPGESILISLELVAPPIYPAFYSKSSRRVFWRLVFSYEMGRFPRAGDHSLPDDGPGLRFLPLFDLALHWRLSFSSLKSWRSPSSASSPVVADQPEHSPAVRSVFCPSICREPSSFFHAALLATGDSLSDGMALTRLFVLFPIIFLFMSGFPQSRRRCALIAASPRRRGARRHLSVYMVSRLLEGGR